MRNRLRFMLFLSASFLFPPGFLTLLSFGSIFNQLLRLGPGFDGFSCATFPPCPFLALRRRVWYSLSRPTLLTFFPFPPLQIFLSRGNFFLNFFLERPPYSPPTPSLPLLSWFPPDSQGFDIRFWSFPFPVPFPVFLFFVLPLRLIQPCRRLNFLRFKPSGSSPAAGGISPQVWSVSYRLPAFAVTKTSTASPFHPLSFFFSFCIL